MIVVFGRRIRPALAPPSDFLSIVLSYAVGLPARLHPHGNRGLYSIISMLTADNPLVGGPTGRVVENSSEGKVVRCLHGPPPLKPPARTLVLALSSPLTEDTVCTQVHTFAGHIAAIAVVRWGPRDNILFSTGQDGNVYG